MNSASEDEFRGNQTLAIHRNRIFLNLSKTLHSSLEKDTPNLLRDER